MDPAKIYPYVVPNSYLQHPPTTAGFVLPLGHDVMAMLVHDLDGLCRNVFEEELAEAGLTSAVAHERAIENLGVLAEGPAIRRSMHRGPNGMPFILWSGHWLSASCIRLPGLYRFGSKYLKEQTFCVSVPQREAMLLFPVGTRADRDAMRSMIRENESDARKPVTLELFTLSAAGLHPFVEQ
jgi:hypothetical protein